MGAIFGLVDLAGVPMAEALLARMDAALAGLGPDGRGLWREGAAGLGHRLARFTPEDRFERQPLQKTEGGPVIVSDGRLDNRPELAEALGIAPEEARGLPDSAFILRAYERWGVECPARLVGTFAFAVWDRRAAHLFAARAPFNAVPFCYHRTASVFAFASRPKGLFALPFVARALNEERFADYLVSAPKTPGQGFYRDVAVLEPGHQLLLRRDGLTLRRFWTLDDAPVLRLAHDDDYVEAFAALFERVVADHMRSVTPVGMLMSGGLDSTAIAAIAARRLAGEGQGLATFTEAPEPGWRAQELTGGRYEDETPLIQAMAGQYPNIRPTIVRPGEAFYFDDIARFFAACEHPFRNAANRPWWEACLRGAAEAGLRVVMTGIGGNLTMSWDGRSLLTELMATGRWASAWAEARALTRAGANRSPWRALASAGLPLLPAALGSAVQRRRAGRPWLPEARPWAFYSAIHPDFARQSRLLERGREKAHSFLFPAERDMRGQRLRSLQAADLGPEIGIGHEEMYGVQLRHPAQDSRIVAFCLSLPDTQAMRDGETRWLLRRAMAGRVPAEILQNPARGIQSAYWLDRLNRKRDVIAAELVRLEGSALAGRILDLPRMRRLLDDLPPSGSDAFHVKIAYRAVFEGGLMAGRFLRWIESGE